MRQSIWTLDMCKEEEIKDTREGIIIGIHKHPKKFWETLMAKLCAYRCVINGWWSKVNHNSGVYFIRSKGLLLILIHSWDAWVYLFLPQRTTLIGKLYNSGTLSIRDSSMKERICDRGYSLYDKSCYEQKMKMPVITQMLLL